jgi:hypothetical protein
MKHSSKQTLSRKKLPPQLLINRPSRSQQIDWFELNDDTRHMISLNNDESQVYSTPGAEKIQWFSIRSASIKSQFDSTLSKMQSTTLKREDISFLSL